MSRHTLSVLVENKPGVLARVSSLFSRRGFNIHSLAHQTGFFSRYGYVHFERMVFGDLGRALAHAMLRANRR